MSRKTAKLEANWRDAMNVVNAVNVANMMNANGERGIYAAQVQAL